MVCGTSRDWYDTWPDRPVFTATTFGRHWRDLTSGFVRDAEAIGALLVRYESLVEGDDKLLDRIETSLGLYLDRTVLAMQVGATSRNARNPGVSALEHLLLRRVTHPLAARLGYRR